jgi:hypothetical protein
VDRAAPARVRQVETEAAPRAAMEARVAPLLRVEMAVPRRAAMEARVVPLLRVEMGVPRRAATAGADQGEEREAAE